MRKLFLGLLLMLPIAAWALAQDSYQFATPEQKDRFNYLTQEFRCLVCQNEALADSNATLAKDLRAQIAQMLQQGASNQQINNYLVQRYGDYILFRPPVSQFTYFLWFGPFALLLLGLIFWLLTIVRQKNNQANKLTLEQQQQIQQLLEGEIK